MYVPNQETIADAITSETFVFALPLFLVIQLHLLGPSSLATFELGSCTIFGKERTSLRSAGAMRRRANDILWSIAVEVSVNEESVEFCDKDKDSEDKESMEQVLCRPMG